MKSETNAGAPAPTINRADFLKLEEWEIDVQIDHMSGALLQACAAHFGGDSSTPQAAKKWAGGYPISDPELAAFLVSDALQHDGQPAPLDHNDPAFWVRPAPIGGRIQYIKAITPCDPDLDALDHDDLPAPPPIVKPEAPQTAQSKAGQATPHPRKDNAPKTPPKARKGRLTIMTPAEIRDGVQVLRAELKASAARVAGAPIQPSFTI